MIKNGDFACSCDLHCHKIATNDRIELTSAFTAMRISSVEEIADMSHEDWGMILDECGMEISHLPPPVKNGIRNLLMALPGLSEVAFSRNLGKESPVKSRSNATGNEAANEDTEKEPSPVSLGSSNARVPPHEDKARSKGGHSRANVFKRPRGVGLTKEEGLLRRLLEAARQAKQGLINKEYVAGILFILVLYHGVDVFLHPNADREVKMLAHICYDVFLDRKVWSAGTDCKKLTAEEWGKKIKSMFTNMRLGVYKHQLPDLPEWKKMFAYQRQTDATQNATMNREFSPPGQMWHVVLDIMKPDNRAALFDVFTALAPDYSWLLPGGESLKKLLAEQEIPSLLAQAKIVQAGQYPKPVAAADARSSQEEHAPMPVFCTWLLPACTLLTHNYLHTTDTALHCRRWRPMCSPMQM